MNALIPIANTGTEYRQSTDAANLCGAIVKQTARDIQGRRYVTVEGWQAIAIAHGCAAGARDVERVDGGVRAIGEVRRMNDGQVISVAEGFVGEDEPTWYGGEQQTKWGKKTLPKRADYAIRAMAQTRAISRACRSAFAHVVVMIDAGLSTTPAEEVPDGGFIEHAPRGDGAGTNNGEQGSAHPAPSNAEPNRQTGVKLDGKYTSITGLEKAIKAFVVEMGTVSAMDEWYVLKNANADLLAQAERDHPDWWGGWANQPDGFTPLRRKIEILEALLEGEQEKENA